VVGGHGSRVSSGRGRGPDHPSDPPAWPAGRATPPRGRATRRPRGRGGAAPAELQQPPVEVSRRSRLLWSSSTHSAVSRCTLVVASRIAIPPSPARVTDRPSLSSHTCQSGPEGAGTPEGGPMTGWWESGGPWGVPYQIRSRPPARSHVHAASPMAGRHPARRRPGQHRRLGRSRPAGPLPRARPARPAAPSRPTPTPATTSPPTATAARPRTPRRSPRATGWSS
jgi:hypothetical protein